MPVNRMTTNSRVVVVGGGIIGAACALELSLSGAQVQVIDSGSDWGTGCSTGNAGLITPSRSLPLASKANIRDGLRSLFNVDEAFRMTVHRSILTWIPSFLAASTGPQAHRNRSILLRMSLSSSKLYDELEAKGLTATIGRGLIHAYTRPGAWDHAKTVARNDVAAGLAVEILSRGEAREFEPALAAATVGALYYANDSYCDPLEMTLALGRAAVSAGAVFHPSTEVLGWRPGPGVIHSAVTTAGDVYADAFVLAAGSASASLSKLAGSPLPIEPGKGYSVDVTSNYVAPRRAILLPERHCVVTPLNGRTRMTSKLELTGQDYSVREKSVTTILENVEAGLQTTPPLQVVGIWRGMRPCSPDGLPIIGRISPFSNLIAATGHGMLGVTLAPLTGKWVTDILLARTGENDRDLHEVRPDRFDKSVGRRSLRGSPYAMKRPPK